MTLQEENEKLRGLLREASESVRYRMGMQNLNHESGRRHYEKFEGRLQRIDAALSQQAEPAPAQDEREACEAAFPPEEGVNWNEAKQRYEAFTAFDRGMRHAVDWQEHTLEVWRKAIAARPAQTEQQPIRVPDRKNPLDHGHMDPEQFLAQGWNEALDEVARLNAAPVAQPAQTERQPVGWQSIVLHASELADMVLKGDAPQTAQRTARALLSMLAAPIAQTEQQPEQSELVDALTQLLGWAEKQVCTHEETHRAGAIWEICDRCGATWADDKGGKPEFEWPEEIEAARAALSAQEK